MSWISIGIRVKLSFLLSRGWSVLFTWSTNPPLSQCTPVVMLTWLTLQGLAHCATLPACWDTTICYLHMYVRTYVCTYPLNFSLCSRIHTHSSVTHPTNLMHVFLPYPCVPQEGKTALHILANKGKTSMLKFLITQFNPDLDAISQVGGV